MTQELHPALDRLVLWTKMHISAVLSVGYAVVLSGLALVVLGGDFPLTSIFTIPAWLVIVGAVLHVAMATARVNLILIPQGKVRREHSLSWVFMYSFLYGVVTIVVLSLMKESIFLGVVSGAVASIYWPKVLDGFWV
jgi:hypothetical protein